MGVALFTRAWIEISMVYTAYKLCKVALFTRAWIEIKSVPASDLSHSVALFTRAWIEILLTYHIFIATKSPSSRGRGLKF